MLKSLLRDSVLWCLLRIFGEKEEAKEFLQERTQQEEKLASLLERANRAAMETLEIMLSDWERSNRELEEALRRSRSPREPSFESFYSFN